MAAHSPPASGDPPTRDAVRHLLGPNMVEHLSNFASDSGVLLLEDGVDAFALRRQLIERARTSIDLQYYIWHDDMTGALLLDSLRRAAARGVRVRLLVDDIGITGLDRTLRWLDGFDRVEVRIFNPFKTRWFKPLDFLYRFGRAHRRMHSKSFTVDGAVTIVGGRNVGDEYFAARREGAFADLDAMGAGPIAAEVEASFASFWQSSEAVAVGALINPLPAASARRTGEGIAARLGEDRTRDYLEKATAAPVLEALDNGTADIVFARVRLLADGPAKIRGDETEPGRLIEQLSDIVGEARRELLIVSGYFVPGRAGAEVLERLAARGVTVKVLTNSFAALDVGPVHAGYAPYRRRLVEAGVELFEMPAPHDRPKVRGKFTGGIRRWETGPGPTLHAKALCVDGERLFVGSLNFDPRSFTLNTELGILIESRASARWMEDRFRGEIAQGTYRVVEAGDGIGWIDERDDEPQVEHTEPGTSLPSRLAVRALSRLPIDWLM